MLIQDYTGSDGVRRVIDAKVFGKELRVYRVYGDVTNDEAILELAQEAAIQNKCEYVRMQVTA